MRNRIKEERERQKISQEELSKKANVARAVISGLESGRITIVKTDTIEKISDALNKKVTDIFF